MFVRIAWGFCNQAFAASRQEHIPVPMQRLLRTAGVVGYWTALGLQGRAVAIWRELRAENRLRRQNEIAGHAVAAWSLPSNTRMKGLGLGRVWAVACPYCAEFHTHAPGEGRRRAHCSPASSPLTYMLQHAGEMPRELRERFRQGVKRDLPRFLAESEPLADGMDERPRWDAQVASRPPRRVKTRARAIRRPGGHHARWVRKARLDRLRLPLPPLRWSGAARLGQMIRRRTRLGG
jgi:hypothetical protein